MGKQAREKRGLQPGLLQLECQFFKDPGCHLTLVTRTITSGDQLGNKLPFASQ